MNYFKTLYLILAASMVFHASGAEPENIYAGEKSSVLIQKTLDSPDTFMPVNPMLIELEFSDDNEKVPGDAFDITANARISQPSNSHNLSLKCGNSVRELAGEKLERDLGSLKGQKIYCFPENEFLILESSQTTDIKIKAVIDTSWRLESSNYTVKAAITPISLIPQNQEMVNIMEGNAEVKASDIVLHEDASGPSKTMYYTAVRKNRGEEPVLEFQGSDNGVVLYRCLSTLDGCTWKKVKTTGSSRITTKIEYEGLYAVTERVKKDKASKEDKRVENPVNGDDSKNETEEENESIQTSGEAEVGEEIEIEVEDRDNYEGQLLLNGEPKADFKNGKTQFTPLEAGTWELTAKKGEQQVEKQLSIKDKTHRQSLTTQIRKKVNNVLYRIIRLLNLLTPL